MIEVKDGKAYFHQFNSREGSWEYVLAPQKYQQLDEALRKWGNPVPEEIAPTEQVVLHRIVGQEVLPELAFWQLVPPWIEQESEIVASKRGRPRLRPPARTHFNSRLDTLTNSSGWLGLLARNRGVVFAQAFFEWSDEELLQHGQMKQAGRFELTGGRSMALAAIWSYATTADGPVPTCSIVTTSPNEVLKGLPHHRMPAILQGDELFRWLDPKTQLPEQLIHPTPDQEIQSTVVAAKRFKDLVGHSQPDEPSQVGLF